MRLHRITAVAALALLATEAAAAGLPVVVLRSVHTTSASAAVDTLETWIAPGRMRVSHHGGDALLDLAGDRFVLLDPRSATYRETSFAAWERLIADSLSAGARAAGRLAFEATEGPGTRLVGFDCQRWHLFTTREIFPGEPESVEREIWVTRELDLPPGASETYARVQASLDRMDLDAPTDRPAGVALRTVTCRHGEGGTREIDTEVVIAIDRRTLLPAAFDVPTGYSRADSAAAAPDRH